MRKFNLITQILMAVLGIVVCIMGLVNQNIQTFWYGVGLILAPFIPLAFELIFKKMVANSLQLIYNIFIFMSIIMGSIVGMYHIVSWWDNLLHFTSGYLLCIVALFIIVKLGEYDRMKDVGRLVFIFAISMAFASLWEIVEFGMDTFFGMTTQNANSTGVLDTMMDMTLHLASTVIFVIHYVAHMLTKKNLFIDSFVNDFKKEFKVK